MLSLLVLESMVQSLNNKVHNNLVVKNFVKFWSSSSNFRNLPKFLYFLIKMTSQPSRHRSKWSVDFSTKIRNNGADLPNPPGYSASVSGIHAEATRQTDPGLRAKRSWDMALGPIKQAPMNLFIM